MEMNDMRGLWRGKRADNGEWIIGEINRHLGVSGKVTTYVIMPKKNSQFDFDEFIPVNANTIGECTCLRDKKGAYIFEGDIVEVAEINGKQIAPITFKKGFFVVDEKCCVIRMGVGAYKRQQLKVIGNIHDNPKLLKGADDDERN